MSTCSLVSMSVNFVDFERFGCFWWFYVNFTLNCHTMLLHHRPFLCRKWPIGCTKWVSISLILAILGKKRQKWQNNNNFTLNRHTMLLHHRPFLWYAENGQLAARNGCQFRWFLAILGKKRQKWQNNNNFTLNRHTMLLHHRPFLHTL